MAATRVVHQDAPTLASDAELAAHEADTTAIHGIADTSVLATGTDLSSHASDTTAIHGIADTSVLATATDVSGAVTTHEGAADPHTGYLKEGDFDDVDFLVGTATGHTGAEIVVGTSPGGELGGTWASPTVDASHSGSTHAATQTAAEATAAAALTAHEAAANPHATYLTQAEGDGLYQPLDSDLTAIAALTTTAFGRGLLALADAAALGAAHSHSGATTTYAPGSFTVATGNYSIMSTRLQLTTTERVTLQGTARLRIT